MSELITGSNGQLGRALQPLCPDGQTVDRQQFDIGDSQAIEQFDWSGIETIVNAAAYTKVDEAETPAGMVAAWRANSQGVANLAAIARAHELTLIHVSSDYVFDGKSERPYSEFSDPNPQSVYGRSKLAGEHAAAAVPQFYLVRSSWVVGDGNNFVRTMLRLGSELDQVSVINDQIGRPTFAEDLAQAIKHLIGQQAKPGIYHFSNSGDPVSWADLANTIFEMAGLDCAVKPVSTAEYSADKKPWAPRPANSMLDLRRVELTDFEIRNWQDALASYVEQELAK